MIQKYIPATKPCKEPTQETAPDHLHSEKDFTREEISRRWIFGAFHAIFSFNHLGEKLLLFVLLTGGVQELIQYRKSKKFPESKREVWSWRNRSEGVQDMLMRVIGLVFLVGFVYYVVVSIPITTSNFSRDKTLTPDL